jgi:hypothetical protein
MAKVITKGWRYGMRKIQFTKLQMQLLDKSLKESNQNMLDVLNKEVAFEFANEQIAQAFLIRANTLGINCEIID